jgi:RNA polymerase sigma-70 factor (ECF subfamily)
VRSPFCFVFAIGSSLKGLWRKQSLTESMSEIPAAGRGFGGQDRKVPACLREAEASLRRSQGVSDDAASAWFIREILPLEAILMHYLQSNWRNASDIPDLRQEVYARVFEAAREHVPDNPKRFLLTSARNLLIDLVRREQVVPMETFADLDTLGLVDDAPEPDRVVMKREELRQFRAALEKLPARTREAIELAYAEGLTAPDIAKRMGVARRTAAEFVTKGTIILADIFGALRDRGEKR